MCAGDQSVTPPAARRLSLGHLRHATPVWLLPARAGGQRRLAPHRPIDRRVKSRSCLGMGGAMVGSMTLRVESGDEAVVSDILWLVAARSEMAEHLRKDDVAHRLELGRARAPVQLPLGRGEDRSADYFTIVHAGDGRGQAAGLRIIYGILLNTSMARGAQFSRTPPESSNRQRGASAAISSLAL
jgi:hypothetical protein